MCWQFFGIRSEPRSFFFGTDLGNNVGGEFMSFAGQVAAELALFVELPVESHPKVMSGEAGFFGIWLVQSFDKTGINGLSVGRIYDVATKTGHGEQHKAENNAGVWDGARVGRVEWFLIDVARDPEECWNILSLTES